MGFGIMFIFIMIQNPSPDPVSTERDAFAIFHFQEVSRIAKGFVRRIDKVT